MQRCILEAVLRIAVEWGVVDLFPAIGFSDTDPRSLGRRHHCNTGATDLFNHLSDFAIFVIPAWIVEQWRRHKDGISRLLISWSPNFLAQFSHIIVESTRYVLDQDRLLVAITERHMVGGLDLAHSTGRSPTAFLASASRAYERGSETISGALQYNPRQYF